MAETYRADILISCICSEKGEISLTTHTHDFPLSEDDGAIILALCVWSLVDAGHGHAVRRLLVDSKLIRLYFSPIFEN